MRSTISIPRARPASPRRRFSHNEGKPIPQAGKKQPCHSDNPLRSLASNSKRGETVFDCRAAMPHDGWNKNQFSARSACPDQAIGSANLDTYERPATTNGRQQVQLARQAQNYLDARCFSRLSPNPPASAAAQVHCAVSLLCWITPCAVSPLDECGILLPAFVPFSLSFHRVFPLFRCSFPLDYDDPFRFQPILLRLCTFRPYR